MDEFISKKFRFHAFFSMVFLIYVHGYNLNNRYLLPFSIVEEPLTFTTYTQYLIANGLLRFRIPILFMISAYLYALGDSKPQGERLKKRLRTLLIPYLFWSAFGLLVTYIWQQFPVTAAAVQAAQIDQLGDNRPYTEIGWGGLVVRWLVAPIAFQLWFIRNLLVYNAAYALLLKAVSRIPKLWFGITIFIWLINFALPLVDSEGLLFFTLGIYIQKNGFNIEKPPDWLRPRIWLPVFIVSAVVKSLLAFQFGWGLKAFIILSLLHKVCVFAGLVTVWYGCDRLVRGAMRRSWFVWLTAFSFIIYAMHVPLVNYCTDLIFAYTNHLTFYRMATFLVLPIAILIITILTGALWRRLSPRLYAFTTGGRGFNP